MAHDGLNTDIQFLPGVGPKRAELIGKELPEGDYETLAGFIMDELQCIPKNGEMNEVVFENVKFRFFW